MDVKPFSDALREEHRLGNFDNRKLRKTYLPKGEEEETGENCIRRKISDIVILRCNAMWSSKSPQTFLRKVLPPSSGSKIKISKKPTNRSHRYENIMPKEEFHNFCTSPNIINAIK